MPTTLFLKLAHYVRRYRYTRTHNMLPGMEGGSGAAGQDMFILSLLGFKRDGFFVDIGANDGVTISNTAALEKDHGWNGVGVEPIPSVFEKFQHNRSCKAVNACVTPSQQTVTFVELLGGPNMLSTIKTNETGLIARRLRKNQQRHNAQRREYEVQGVPFDDLIQDRTHVDFLSLDIEGGELGVLRSIDFDTVHIQTISVENNHYRSDLRRFLESKSFAYIGTFGVDEIYLNRQRPPLHA